MKHTPDTSSTPLSHIDLAHLRAHAADYELVGKGQYFDQLLVQFYQARSNSAAVLLYGPDASGKRAWAWYLARCLSENNQQAIQEIDCAQHLLIQEQQTFQSVLLLINVCHASPEMQKNLVTLVTLHKKHGYKVIATAVGDLFMRVQNGLFDKELYALLADIPIEFLPQSGL